MKNLFCALFFMLFLSTNTFSFSCAPPPPPEEAMKKADAVFVGKVVAGSLHGDYERKFTFEIKDDIKGNLGKEVIIYTGLGGGDGGYDFIIGEKYLVYAWGDKFLQTNIGSRTVLYSTPAEQEVQKLKEIIEIEKILKKKAENN